MSAKKRKVCGLDISLELLLPGVAIVTGGRDVRGGPVMECQRKTFEQRRIELKSIVNLFEYLATVPRSEVRKIGLSIVVDARDTPQNEVQTLLDAVALFHASDSSSVYAVYVVGALEPPAGEFVFQIVSLREVDQLTAYISVDQLTSSFGGTAAYDHEQWIRFRFAIEPFLTDCSSCAKTLKAAIQEAPPSGSDSPPVSPQESAESLLKKLRVNDLIKESGQIVGRLCNPPPDWQSLAWSPDFKGLTAYINQMAAQLEKLKAQLEATSGGRKRRETKEYPVEIGSKESLDKVLQFIGEEGKEFLEQGSIAESLGGAGLLLYDMTDFEETAKNVLTNGRTAAEKILKEGNKDECEKAKAVLQAIQSFVEKMNERRGRLEFLLEFHQLIDKAFSWNVQAARFLSRQTVAPDSDDAHLSNLLAECEAFHQKHSGLTKEDVDRLSSLVAAHLGEGLPAHVRNQVEEALLANEEADGRFQGRWQFIESLLRKENWGSDSDAASVDFESFAVSDSEDDEPDSGSGSGEIQYFTSTATASLSALTRAITEAKSAEILESDSRDSGAVVSEEDVDSVSQTESVSSPPPPPANLGKEGAKIKKRKQLIQELLETEEKYVDDLGHVCKDYVNAYLTSDKVPSNMRGKSNILFGNMATLLDFNKNKLLPELKKYSGTPLKLGLCFSFFEQEFGYYSLYFKNMPAQEQMLQDDSPREFFRSVQIRLNDPFNLLSYLIKPFQRMVKYRQFLEEIKQNAPSGLQSKTAADLDAAIHLIKFQLRHGNDLLALDSLKGFDGNIDEQGALLLQDDFIVTDRRGRHKRRIFLFEESVLFSKQREVKGSSSCFDYKGSMKTADMGLTETKENDPRKFEIWFRRRRQHDTVSLLAENVAKKAEWVQEIHQILFHQMKRLKEHKARSSQAPALAPRRQRSTMGFSMASGVSSSNQTPRTSINIPGRRSTAARMSTAVTSSYIQVIRDETRSGILEGNANRESSASAHQDRPRSDGARDTSAPP